MINRQFVVSLAVAVTLGSFAAAQYPQAEIANSQIRAKLYLPDARSGYYRATRFDWSGVIASLEWNGHSYFGQWFERYDPKLHDAIMGPVEEFVTSPGYDDAKAGEDFVRIGVGAVRRPPDETVYHQFQTYEIADPGAWTVKQGKDWIEFTHQLRDTAGYAYVYRKKVHLTKNKLVLEHRLKNTGRKAIATSVYQHNFFMLDKQPTGPDFSVRLPFDPRATRPLNGLAETRGKEFVYLKELQDSQTAFTELQGFGSSVKDYDIRVENRKTGAAVRQTSDRPMSKLMLWSPRSTVCPEAYIDLRVEPGKESSWKIVYEFYQIGKP